MAYPHVGAHYRPNDLEAIGVIEKRGVTGMLSYTCDVSVTLQIGGNDPTLY